MLATWAANRFDRDHKGIGMLRCLITTSVLVLAPLAACTQVAPPPNPAVAHSGLIRMAVRVTDQRHEPVADLEQKDFTVFDNGVERPIRTFQRLEMSQQAEANGSQRALYTLEIDQAPETAQKTFHNLEVRVDRRNLDVRTMKGYYTGPGYK